MENKSTVSSATLVLALILAALVGLFSLLFIGLPSQIKADILKQGQRTEQARKNLVSRQATLAKAVNADKELFAPPGFDAEWARQYKQAESALAEASAVALQLDGLSKANKRGSMREVETLLDREQDLRQKADNLTAKIDSAYDARLKLKRDLPDTLREIESSSARLLSSNYAPVKDAVEKAEKDWPAKREDLSKRLDALTASQKQAAQWQQAAKAIEPKVPDKITAADYAQVQEIQTRLDRTSGSQDALALTALSGQLYTEWDKVLKDLDRQGRDYRSRIEQVVTTVPAPDQKGTTAANSSWEVIPEPEWRAYERNVGMTLAHKDFGKYDSEANRTPEPPGFAYMASPEQGRNQYGYWERRAGGSFWTWLPEYLILRDLLSNRHYQPVPSTDWQRYQQVQRSGGSYYGADPKGVPKYGSSGTFTRQSYTDSRYVQNGGFAGSKYASDRNGFSGSRYGSGAAPSAPAGKGGSFGSPSSGGGFSGSRYGGGSSSFGQKFGSGKSAGKPGGMRFGRAPRSSGRGFGRRR